MTIGDILKDWRAQSGYSMDDVSKKTGLSKAYISILERNYNPSTKRPAIPSLETIRAIADAMGEDVNRVIELLDGDQKVSLSPIPPGFQPTPELSRVPRVGRIACGEPITAEENIEDYDDVPAKWHSDFTLLCEGESMLPRIQDGDIVAIHKQPIVENGEIAAVRVGTEATLKRVFVFSDHIELRAENPEYPTIIRIGEEMNDVVIEGKAVGLCRKI